MTQGGRGSVKLNPDGTVTYLPDSARPFRVIQTDLAPGGGQPNSGVSPYSIYMSFSRQDPQLAITSMATNLSSVPGSGSNAGYMYDVVHRTLSTMQTLTYNGIQPNIDSFMDSTSASGRLITFETGATNMLSGSSLAAGNNQVYVRDRVTGKLSLVTVGFDGQPGNNSSSFGWMTTDGSYVVFTSSATNLTYMNTEGQSQVYERNLVTGVTELVSVNDQGVAGNGSSYFGIPTAGVRTPGSRHVSDDGRYVVFTSTAPNLGAGSTGSPQIFLRDTLLKKTTWVNTGFSVPVQAATITADGTQIIFFARLPPSSGQAYAYDIATGVTSPFVTGIAGAALNHDGIYWLTNSADNRYVPFTSDATNVVSGVTDGNYHCYLWDRALDKRVLLDVNPDGSMMSPTGDLPGISLPGCQTDAVSSDGLYAAIAEQAVVPSTGSTGANIDIYVITRSDQFAYTAADESGRTATGTVTITEPLTGLPGAGSRNKSVLTPAKK